MATSKPGSTAKSEKAAPPATVTLRHLAAELAERHDLPKKQAQAVLSDALVIRHLKKGNRLRVNGLGILQVRKRAARMGRNPATGEAISSGQRKSCERRSRPALLKRRRRSCWCKNAHGQATSA